MEIYSEMINITKICDGIFIGDSTAGTTLDIIFEFKISHMINTASNLVPSQFSSIGIKYLNFNWTENPLSKIPIITDDLAVKVVNFIDSCLKNGDGVMIFSLKGQNRCCVTIIIYLMKKYFWSLEKCKQYLLSKKQDMKITKCFLEQLHNYEIHLHKIYPNKKKSTNWTEVDIKDNKELLMTNTYINEVELKKKNDIIEFKIKNSIRHVGWADDTHNFKNENNNERKLVNCNIENDLYFKKNVQNITCHLTYKDLKSIIKNNKDEDKNNKNDNNNNEIKIDSSLEEKNKNGKMELFNTQNIMKDKNDKEGKLEDSKNEEKIIKDKLTEKINKNGEKLKENNLNYKNNILENKESLNEIKINKECSKNNNNKLNLNIIKNSNEKEQNNNLNTNKRLQINMPLKEYDKIGLDKNINIHNNININNMKKKQYNNFIDNDNINKNLKNNNINSIYLKTNKTQKKSRSTSKTSLNKNVIPFIEYNQSNNLINNIINNNTPQMIDNNQKLFVKFNKDNNNAINNNKFIQNNNFININYFPTQNNEGK